MLVHDQIASAALGRCKWSFHVGQRVNGHESAVRVESEQQVLCRDLLQESARQLEQHYGFGSVLRSTRRTDLCSDQWYAAFVATEPSAQAEYAASLRVGGEGGAPRIKCDGTGQPVFLAGPGSSRDLRLDGQVTVQ